MRWLIGAAGLAALVVAFLLYGLDDPELARSRGPGDRTPRTGPVVLPAAPPARTAVLSVAVAGPDGAPAAGARLSLSGPVPVNDARADAQGRWKAHDLPPGDYVLLARTDSAAGSIAFPLDGDTDLGTLRLDRATVWSGLVLSPRGEGVDGARVEAVDGDDAPLATGRAGDDGSFSLLVPFADVAATLRAWHPDVGLAVRPRLSRATPRTDLHLTLSPGGTVRGVVVDDAGRAIPGARVTLECHERGAAGREPLRAATTTDARGAFELGAAAARRHVLTVHARGFAPWRESSLEVPALGLRVVLGAAGTARLRVVEADAPGVPIPGASCTTQHGGGITRAVADEDGRAVLEDLPASGNVRILVQAPGFVADDVDVRLRAGGVDLGDLGLARGGLVTGTVRSQPNGEPVAGATVLALPPDGPAWSRTGGNPETVSDGTGRFELRGVPLGTRWLVALAPGYRSGLDPRALRRGGPGDAEPLFPEGSTVAERDVVLLPAATLRGLVILPDGGPANGARVLRIPLQPTLEQMLGSWTEEAWTDAEGRFVLDGVDPERGERLVALHPSYASSEVVAVSGAEEWPTLRLRRATTAVGRVVDEAGAPLAGCVVQVSGGGVAGWAAVPEPVRTGADGRFTLPGLPPVPLTLTFNDEERRVVRRAVTPREHGGEIDFGDVVLARAQGIEGIVLDEHGDPVAGVGVTATFESGNTPRDPEIGEGRTLGQAKSGRDGRFSIAGLRAGRYRLRALAEGFVSDRPLVPTGARDAVVRMQREASLEGRVVSAGRPVEGAFVRAILEDAGPAMLDVARTDEGGRFRLDGLPSGTEVAITVTSRDLLDRTVRNVRAPGDPLTIELEPGARVGGRVVDERGAPVPEAAIVINVDGSNAGWVRTGPDGGFLASGLPNGRITVQVQGTKSGHLRGSPVEAADGTLDLELRVVTGARIAGRVTDAGGRPVSGVRVTALDAAGRPVTSTWIWDAVGGFELRGLPKGRYDVVVSRPDAAGGEPPAARAASVPTGTEDLVIRLE